MPPGLVGMADEIDAEWGRLCAGNPRYFNGPILVVETMAEDAGTASGVIRARRGEFKHLAVRPAVETGVGQLGVTGVLEARDATGEAFVLLGKRSAATRIFGGMWELGPSGGVDPPPASESAMDWQDVWRALVEEIREEVGLAVEPDPAPPLALVDDPVGHSVEVVVPGADRPAGGGVGGGRGERGGDEPVGIRRGALGGGGGARGVCAGGAGDPGDGRGLAGAGLDRARRGRGIILLGRWLLA